MLKVKKPYYNAQSTVSYKKECMENPREMTCNDVVQVQVPSIVVYYFWKNLYKVLITMYNFLFSHPKIDLTLKKSSLFKKRLAKDHLGRFSRGK